MRGEESLERAREREGERDLFRPSSWLLVTFVRAAVSNNRLHRRQQGVAFTVAAERLQKKSVVEIIMCLWLGKRACILQRIDEKEKEKICIRFPKEAISFKGSPAIRHTHTHSRTQQRTTVYSYLTGCLSSSDRPLFWLVRWSGRVFL